ncbi:response regulator transcription factor [Gemelliphila palaticanis]|uniref:Response regulator transcription factor n=1 Tax=Gemelliphila palaticanis TaxID=81950 RepID=A0ABX2SYT9_9BACL|nr:response regulator transcription factor [Gemella palaticanis]MBF0715081.1 response regulator transcription factor [Gemella palaticanis]NYS47011.1 response regulator transcription factor [Gemella palaticanis]
MKILVVEDEKDLNNILVRYLKKNNFSVDYCYNGEEAIDFVNLSNYDVIILDVMMPQMDGYEFLRWLRNKNIPTPVLMLTAKDALEDKVTGLNYGADDYLVKPFELEELIARIRAIIRRSYGNISNEIVLDDLKIDISKKIVTRANVEINLTGKEYEVLEFLLQNKNKIVSREQIQNSVWDYDYDGASNIIDVIIKNIRKKIDLGSSKPIIHTKRGLGYVAKED